MSEVPTRNRLCLATDNFFESYVRGWFVRFSATFAESVLNVIDSYWQYRLGYGVWIWGFNLK